MDSRIGSNSDKNAYFRELKVDYWFNRVNRHLTDYKATSEQITKAECVIDIYTTYLQLIEILFINIKAASTPAEGFYSELFIQSNDLREYILEAKNPLSLFQKHFFKEWIKPIVQEFDQTGNPDKTMRNYKRLIKEVIEDYGKDYQLLNAYKHGFRVKFVTENAEWAIGNESRATPLGTTDARISYSYSKKIKHGSLAGLQGIHECYVEFNTKRIFGKAVYVYTLLENVVTMQKQIAEPGQNQNYRTFDLDADHHDWNSGHFTLRSDFLVGYTKKP